MPNDAFAELQKELEKILNDTNFTIPSNFTFPSNFTETNFTNNYTNTSEDKDPSQPPIPDIPEPPCFLYGIERYKGSDCKELDKSFTSEGIKVAENLNRALKYNTCSPSGGDKN